MSHSVIEAAWRQIDLTKASGASYARLRVCPECACAVYAAKKSDTTMPAVIFEAPKAAVQSADRWPQCAGFRVVVESSGDVSSRVIIDLTDSRFSDVFAVLASDLVRHASICDNARSVIDSVMGRLWRWRDFLNTYGLTPMSPQARRGLFGELAFLRDDALVHVDAAGALQSWRGVHRENHDFQFSWCSVEVKTTSANTPHGVRVSNIRQLDDNSVPSLYLHVILVDETENGSESLSDIIADVRSRLQESLWPAFEDALLNAGFLEILAHHYALPRYTIRSTRTYEVREGFPRMTESSLPIGVEDVRYTVALAACAPFEASRDDIGRGRQNES